MKRQAVITVVSEITGRTFAIVDSYSRELMRLGVARKAPRGKYGGPDWDELEIASLVTVSFVPTMTVEDAMSERWLLSERDRVAKAIRSGVPIRFTVSFSDFHEIRISLTDAAIARLRQ